jgi:hypothetical protein
MLAEARFCMGAKVGSRASLQTYDMFASTWFVNYDMFASRLTRIVTYNISVGEMAKILDIQEPRVN